MVVTLTADVALNGGGVDVTVYQDSDGDGTPENAETITVDDGTNTYDLYAVSPSSGSDIWLEFSVTSTSIDSSPVVRSATYETGTDVFGGQIATTVAPQGAVVPERSEAGGVQATASPQGATVTSPSGISAGGTDVVATPQAGGRLGPSILSKKALLGEFSTSTELAGDFGDAVVLDGEFAAIELSGSARSVIPVNGVARGTVVLDGGFDAVELDGEFRDRITLYGEIDS